MIQIFLILFFASQHQHPACCSVPAEPPKLLAMLDQSAAPALEGTAAVSGTVVAVDQPLPNDLVIYLEPKDPAVRYAPSANRPRVLQKGAQFAPALTVISVGQSVEFVNDEDRPIEHNVFSNSPALPFDLGLFPQRESRAVQFDKPGPVVLYCSVHKFMDGAVFVCPTPMFARPDAGGRYEIKNVAAGDYTLKVWHRRPRFLSVEKPVHVEATSKIASNLELRRK